METIPPDILENSKYIINVFCSASLPANDPLQLEFYQLGKTLAKRGYVVRTGGTNQPGMDTIHRAVHEAGGKLIGITCDGIAQKSSYLSENIVTDTLGERLALLAYGAAASILCQGGIGTATELLYLLHMHKSHPMIANPIICAKYWKPFIDALKKNPLSVPQSVFSAIHYVDKLEQAVELLPQLIKGN